MTEESMGASPNGVGLSSASPIEPVPVSPVPASIPCVWQDYGASPPPVGTKVVIVCDDGCSTALALMTDDGPLDGECAEQFYGPFLDGAIWMPLPEDYPLGFMQTTEDDWY